MSNLNKFVQHELNQRGSLGVTASIWDALLEQLKQAPVICFKEHPSAYSVAYWGWRLIRKHLIHALGTGDVYRLLGMQHLMISFLMLGFLGGVLCGCQFCSGLRLDEPGGSSFLNERKGT